MRGWEVKLAIGQKVLVEATVLRVGDYAAYVQPADRPGGVWALFSTIRPMPEPRFYIVDNHGDFFVQTIDGRPEWSPRVGEAAHWPTSEAARGELRYARRVGCSCRVVSAEEARAGAKGEAPPERIRWTAKDGATGGYLNGVFRGVANWGSADGARWFDSRGALFECLVNAESLPDDMRVVRLVRRGRVA